MANTQNLDLVKPLGTDHALVSVLNSNSDKIDAYAGAVNASLDGLRDGLGILADGNTHAAITSGQFVYVKNHQTLPQGLYQATTNIAANGTLSTSNLTADPKGGLNTLSEQIVTVYSNAAKKTNVLNFVTYSDITGASLDSITTEGIYHNWFRDGTPFDNSWGVMFVINRSNVMEQIIINQGGIAKRHYESGSWSSWKKVSFT